MIARCCGLHACIVHVLCMHVASLLTACDPAGASWRISIGCCRQELGMSFGLHNAPYPSHAGFPACRLVW